MSVQGQCATVPKAGYNDRIDQIVGRIPLKAADNTPAADLIGTPAGTVAVAPVFAPPDTLESGAGGVQAPTPVDSREVARSEDLRPALSGAERCCGTEGRISAIMAVCRVLGQYMVHWF